MGNWHLIVLVIAMILMVIHAVHRMERWHLGWIGAALVVLTLVV